MTHQQLSKEDLRQQIIKEMEARRIDHKTYIDTEWLLEQYEQSLLTSHSEALRERVKELPEEHHYNTSGVNMSLINRADVLALLTDDKV